MLHIQVGPEGQEGLDDRAIDRPAPTDLLDQVELPEGR
jgi:hypothetical protein